MSTLRKWCNELYISIVITLLSISSASVFVLFFRPIYYLSIKGFGITGRSGFNKNQIIENYDALIQYFYPFHKGNLALPTFGQSAQGIQHFAEVKDIFNVLLLMIPICLLLLILYVIRNRSGKHYLKTTAITLILVPVVFGTGFTLNFDQTFTLFHKIFFRNDYWLFNSKTDPIIKILPEEFFLLCGVIIIIIQIVLSVFCYTRYRHSIHRSNAK